MVYLFYRYYFFIVFTENIHIPKVAEKIERNLTTKK